MPGLPESTRLATPSGHPESGRMTGAIIATGPSQYAMQPTGHEQYHSGASLGARNRDSDRGGHVR